VSRSAGALLGRHVTLGQQGGGARVTDVVLGADLGVALGLVLEHDGRRCFVPWGALSLAGDTASSTLATLLGEVELAFYLESGVTLTRLRGARVAVEGGEAGAVEDVLIDLPSGRVSSLVVAGAGGVQDVDPGRATVRWLRGRIVELRVSDGAARGDGARRRRSDRDVRAGDGPGRFARVAAG
jgi:hypothetical protein